MMRTVDTGGTPAALLATTTHAQKGFLLEGTARKSPSKGTASTGIKRAQVAEGAKAEFVAVIVRLIQRTPAAMGSDVVEHGHHGHHAPKHPPVPDYRIYKVEDVPRLVKMRDTLARQGLKDPWIRNEVWRYSLYTKTPPRAALMKLATRGLKPGFLLAVGTVVLEKAYDYVFKKDDHHHHGDAHH